MMRSAESQDTISPNLIADNMAIAFVKSSVAGRGGGKSATAMAAYRSGSIIVDKASGKIHDYTKKSGVDHSEILSPIAPTNSNKWLTDRTELWNCVEAGEKRYDAQLAREIVIAIPRELDRDDQIALVCEYIQSSFVDRGMVADINLHHLDGDNPHAHVMLTMRELKIDEQGTVSFGNKDRTWNDKKLLAKQKLEWDGFANQYLKRAGFDVRIDSRSYEEQGIERIPQVHLGAEAARMKARGISTAQGNQYDRIETANNNISQILEQIYESELATREAEQALAKLKAGVKHQEQIKSMLIQVVDIVSLPEPVVKKWEPTLKQKTDLQLVSLILETAKELGTDGYLAGNYQVQILAEQIEIKYRDELAMIITISSGQAQSQLIDRSHTLNQYERGLGESINVLMTDLEQQREQEQIKAQEQEQQQHEAELQRQLEQQQEQERELFPDVSFHDSEINCDDLEIDFSEPLEEQDRSRGYGWSR
jgi:MobA/MobL family